MYKAETDPKGAVLNHCPCGCSVDDLDEYGYCHHLIGFTNDGKLYEPLRPLPDKRGNRVIDGAGRRPTRGHHILVNPESMTPEGMTRKKWVSSRVYDKNAAKPKCPEPTYGREEPETELEPTAKV